MFSIFHVYTEISVWSWKFGLKSWKSPGKVLEIHRSACVRTLHEALSCFQFDLCLTFTCVRDCMLFYQSYQLTCVSWEMILGEQVMFLFILLCRGSHSGSLCKMPSHILISLHVGKGFGKFCWKPAHASSDAVVGSRFMRCL